MPITVLGGTTSAAAAFEVANSCRFNEPDSAYMSRTLGTATNAKKFTISFWIKRCNVGNYEVPFECGTDGNNFGKFYFHEGGTLRFYQASSGSAQCSLTTNQLFRDPTAWMHIVMAVDTTQGTAGNRNKLYINGTQVTSFSTQTNFGENDTGSFNGAVLHTIGRDGTGTTDYLDAYLAEFVFIDGTQYAASDFGEFDEDSPRIWKPKDVSGLTFGNNGAYLDFEDSGNLGDDESGNTNDWAESSLAATDQSTDTPTNNFCTINPLDEPYGSVTLTEGNLVQVQTSDYPYNRATMGVAKGKWYFEGKGVATSGDSVIGIASVAASSSTNALYIPANNYAYYSHASNHGAYSNNALVVSTNYDAYTDDDIISVAFDLDNNKLYFAKNGTWANSGDPTSGSTGTGAVSITAAASTVDGFYFPAAADYGGSPRTTWSMNFGSPAHTVSSGNADANGYGNFEYAVPSGYYALCTKNLAEFG